MNWNRALPCSKAVCSTKMVATSTEIHLDSLFPIIPCSTKINSWNKKKVELNKHAGWLDLVKNSEIKVLPFACMKRERFHGLVYALNITNF